MLRRYNSEKATVKYSGFDYYFNKDGGIVRLLLIIY